MKSKNSYLRFTVLQRVEHVVLYTTFIALVVTGMPIKYPNTWWSPIVINLLGGFDMRTLIHHVAGIGMCLEGAFHVIYYPLLKKGPKEILPRQKDVYDFFQHMLNYLRLSDRIPRFGRFSWKEKFDYWGGLWGMVLMCFTGGMLMYPLFFMKFIPLSWVHLGRLLHSDEALIASIAIFIWHFWNVHFNPHAFPMNWAWLTGKLSRKEMADEHPIELENIELLENSNQGGHAK